MKATPESPRMFENDLLDGLSRTPWYTVPLVWLPVTAATFAYGVVWQGAALGPSIGLAIAGLFAWTFAEYWLHRTFFHWEPDTWWGPKLHFLVHGVHHEWFKDPYRLVMPPTAAAVLYVAFFGIFRLIFGPVWMHPFFAGFILGYIGYDLTHYAIHHVRPNNVVLKRLKAHHMNHHFNNPERKFGVSTTLWDHVFQTWETPARQQTEAAK